MHVNMSCNSVLFQTLQQHGHEEVSTLQQALNEVSKGIAPLQLEVAALKGQLRDSEHDNQRLQSGLENTDSELRRVEKLRSAVTCPPRTPAVTCPRSDMPSQ